MGKVGKLKVSKPEVVKEEANEPLSGAEALAWEELYRKAEAMLDEQGLEQLEKRRHVAGKMLKRMGVSEPPIAVNAVKRVYLRYKCILEEEEHTRGMYGFMASIRYVGAKKSDVLLGWTTFPESKVVYEYISKQRDALMALANEELLMKAREAQGKLLTEDDCKLSTKMAMFTLEHLDSKTYGEQEVAKAAGDGGAQTVYRISGVTINMLPQGVSKGSVGEVIDGEEVKVALPIGEK